MVLFADCQVQWDGSGEGVANCQQVLLLGSLLLATWLLLEAVVNAQAAWFLLKGKPRHICQQLLG